jgi:hypothetical protein
VNQNAPLHARPFVGFGQFIVTGGLAVMAFTILHRRDLAKARRLLTRARTDLGVPASMRFDGATLFGQGEAAIPVERRKAVDKLIEVFNGIPGMVRYTWVPVAAYPDPVDDTPEGRRAQAAIRGVLVQACFAVPEGGMHGPQEHECEPIAVDGADRTSYAHGVMLDLADLFAYLGAHHHLPPDDGWAHGAVDRLRYWSFQELRARLQDRPPAEHDATPAP